MIYWKLFSYSAKERHAYQALMEKADPSRANDSSPYVAKQQHTGVRKDITALKDGKNVHFRLFSKDTELILDHHDAQTDVIERMNNVVCYMQEKLLSVHEENVDKPVQVIQYLEAEKAAYYYQSEKLVAERVKISRFLAPGHTLEDNLENLQPLMEGTAASIEFSLAGKEPKFEAADLTAILQTEKGQPIAINSKQAKYDGKLITLNGNVIVQHDAGNINAQKVVLLMDDGQRKMHLNRIHLSDEVRLTTASGGELTCSHAEIDYQMHQGEFYSDSKQPVIYRELNAQSKPLMVKSDHMSVEMDSGAHEKNCRKGLRSVAAKGHVSVNFNDFIATADNGTYQRIQKAGVKEEGLSGLIVLSASQEDQGICEVSNLNGDRIVASEIWMDTLERNVHCLNPDGVLLYATQAKEKPNKVHFSCKSMNWNEASQCLTLSEEVKIEQEGLGVITTDDQIAFVRQYIEGVPQLCTAVSTGNTVFVYTDLEKQENHTLKCQGKATIDHPQQQIRIESPQDSVVGIAKDKQIFFQDPLGDIFSDKMTVDYAVNDQKFAVSKVHLDGHVHLHNNGSIEPGKTKAFLEFALADMVEYFPNTKEVLLSALSKRRVLFFDKVNNLQISAPKLKIKRDVATQQDSVQGIGDVRFSFVKNELDELKKFMD